jgi:long-chain acyl-CoA synthetase
LNLFALLEETARRSPHNAAVVKGDDSCSYGELHSAACRLAADLTALDLGAGARVGVMFANGAEYVAAAFAVLAAGGVVVSISPAVRDADVAALFHDMDLDGFCCSARFAPLIAPLSNVDSRPRPILSGKDPLILQRSARAAPAAGREALREVNAATIRSSSGTTGIAKGIIVSHEALLERAKTYCEAPPLDEGAAVLWLRPMARPEIYAFVRQAATIVAGDAMNPRDAMERVRRRGVTHVYAAPIFYRTLLAERGIGPGDFATVKYFLTGGSALGRSLADAFAARYQRDIAEHYGAAECATVLINLSQRADKRGSAGLPVRAEVKLAGAEDTGAEAMGELLVRCSGMFDGYYKPWRSRDEVLEDGWFRTGDIARRDADGYYWIVGRSKEVINVGGMKVFPQELEDILLAHPAVEEALVYGAPAPRFGEAPRAKVKLRAGMRATEKEIMDFANAKLSVFRMLRGVEFVDEIAKTPTGKPRRWTPAQ